MLLLLIQFQQEVFVKDSSASFIRWKILHAPLKINQSVNLPIFSDFKICENIQKLVVENNE